MNAAGIVPVHFPEARRKLRDELGSIYTEMAIRSAQQITAMDPRASWAPMLIADFLELAFESISSGDYDEFFDWAGNLKCIDEERRSTEQLLFKMLIQELEKVCERTVPRFSLLLGEIHLRLTQLERISKNPQHKNLFLSSSSNHDLIDVEVDNIIRSLERKDPATGIHSRAVSLWCQLLSQKLGLSKEMIQFVTRGGLIHDIGKVRVPNEVLQAPRKLSDDEWKIMASHVTIGHEMLLQIPVLHPYQYMVRNHHEHFKGGGYPDNLAGEDIPLATRIVTVADCFNAMIGQRPYRRQMPTATAIQELRRCRGVQFDADVVDAMIEISYKKLPTAAGEHSTDLRWETPPLEDYWE